MLHSLVRQFSVAVSDEPGSLARICALLARAEVTLHALIVVDSGDQGVVRCVPCSPEKARQALAAAGLAVTECELLAIDAADAGGLAALTGLFAEAGLNLCYGYSGHDARGATVFYVKCEDLGRAVRLLAARA